MFKQSTLPMHKPIKTRWQLARWHKVFYVPAFASLMALASCGQAANNNKAAENNQPVAGIVSETQGIQADSLVRQMARTVMTIWKDPSQSGQHAYKNGVTMKVSYLKVLRISGS
ncbi:hypothetical protein [Arachidicoccus ginsenosidivorans]|uniref:hypothetical protein n=1 Tax=Arachidicoccus ginsenosidivorans TaxID=496057 RepID=UPI001CEF82A4|nr:hypothetical protein [Arachidicoccus ginsenosidivorans]